MKKRILYFMPDNPTKGKAGNLTRCLKVLDYFHENYSDLASIEFLSVLDWGEWDRDGIDSFRSRYPLINLSLINRKIPKNKPIKRLLFYKLYNLIPKLLRGISVDITNLYFRKKIKNHLNKTRYDVVIMSYSSWGSLASLFNYNPYLILDTHDFITAQSRNQKNQIGRLFQSELNILRLYDEIWTLSVEEKYIYEQFTSAHVLHHPVTYPGIPLKPKSSYKYDIIYVASINPHNTSSIHWFLEKVLPRLKNYKIHIVGRICSTIEDVSENIIKHGMVEDLDYFYSESRIAICPMLSGTGVKIKVVEALANNIPVVTSTRGVDGLINKVNNGCLVADSPEEFANHIVRLLEDNDFFEKKKIEAFEYFQNCHSPSLEKKLFSSIDDKIHSIKIS
jgi:glycosyltransferase involved in cell wall biosynthesis